MLALLSARACHATLLVALLALAAAAHHAIGLTSSLVAIAACVALLGALPAFPLRAPLLVAIVLYVGVVLAARQEAQAERVGRASAAAVEGFRGMSLAERMFAVTGVKNFAERRERFTNRIKDIDRDIAQLRSLYGQYRATGKQGAREEAFGDQDDDQEYDDHDDDHDNHQAANHEEKHDKEKHHEEKRHEEKRHEDENAGEDGKVVTY